RARAHGDLASADSNHVAGGLRFRTDRGRPVYGGRAEYRRELAERAPTATWPRPTATTWRAACASAPTAAGRCTA
ncbi:hypothetical protein, partial [Hymenobacter coccineus]|uniref:hypothetical protein n=1 Tax=Hymenobacter coccineus TaxID=1908235 RepID=UPI0013019927